MFGIVIAFKNYRAFKPNTFWNNIIKSDWVGLKNFEFLKSPDTAVMIRNTLGYNLLWIVLGLVIAVAFAIMMSELLKPLRRQGLPDHDVLPVLPQLGSGKLLRYGVP